MLEPIEESDLDLKNKFLKGGVPKGEKPVDMVLPKINPEAKSSSELAPTPEAPERKEGKMEKDDAYAKILAKAQNPIVAVQGDVSTDAKIANDMVDYESKIIKLVEMAEAKGVVHAVKVAKHLEDNYLLDELHDRLLAADLHDALVKKGMITKT